MSASMKGKGSGMSSSYSKARQEWPDLPATSCYIKRSGWELRAIPEDLASLPDAVTIPEKLQQIITWSLIPGSNWSFERLKTSPTKNGLTISDDKPKDAGERNGLSPLVNIGRDAGIHGNDNLSTSSFKTAQTQSSSTSTTGRLADAEQSLKSKLLSKIGFSKPEVRTSATIATVKEGAQAKTESALVECTSCFEELPREKMTRLKSCQHWYCSECLGTLIVTAMAAEVSFPPKCCLSPIPLKQVLKALDAKQREDYQAKAAEYAVPATNRWYCPNKDCLKWIPPTSLKINKEMGYNCPHCSSKLCRTCRGPAHPANTLCPQDFGLDAILETAEIEGWQRCYKCRTMVEHSTGCRHMTCRCRAEFCYVCGLRWQTCSCTETDAANKRAGVQRRRVEATTKHDEEAAEIARAIAEVEEMERREAEDRRLDEERHQREEEEQLQLLEAIRLEEEARKKQEAEQAERDLQKVLVSSFKEEWHQMEQVLYKLMAIQSAAIISRHQTEDSRLGTLTNKDEEDVKREFEDFTLILKRNACVRRNRLTLKQKTDTEALAIRQEEEEDDMFVQVQRQLRGKVNKESRMERMLAEFRKQQDDEEQELEDKQKAEMLELEEKIALDTEGLRRWYDTRIQLTKDHQLTALRKFGYQVGADRQYYEIVFERRVKMLAQHGQKCVSSIEAGEEPTGLTEYEASRIAPYLPELDDGEQGPSGINRGPAVIMTPHGPLTMDSERVQSASTKLRPERLDDGQRTPTQPRPSRPPIPGSFPVDDHSFSQCPPPTPPSRHPQHHHRPPTVVVAPLPLGGIPRMHSQQQQQPLTPTSLNSSARRKAVPPRITTSNNNAMFPDHQAQPQPLSQQSISNAMPAIRIASLAAGMALQMLPQHQQQPQSRPQGHGGQHNQNTHYSNPTIEFRNPPNSHHQQQQQHSRPNQVQPPSKTSTRIITTNPVSSTSSLSSLKTAGLNAKKSRWGFIKHRELTEDEVKKRMRQTVGDAF